MYAEKLKEELFALAHSIPFLSKHYTFGVNSVLPKSAVIFNTVDDNFHSVLLPFKNWKSEWQNRLTKEHSHFPGMGIVEMQSSNSSDALLMNIFCHPELPNWKGVANLFGVAKIEKEKIEFGYNPAVPKMTEGDATEVDLHLNGEIICEAKLTEESFTQKSKGKMFHYKDFTKIFALGYLPQSDTHFYNYQLIRNILAAHDKKMSFFLLCDTRRPDLVRSFIDTVACIIDVELRSRCKIIFWQDIAAASGKDLKDFLKAKYGI